MIARPNTSRKAISAIEQDMRFRPMSREELRQCEERLRYLKSLLFRVKVGA